MKAYSQYFLDKCTGWRVLALFLVFAVYSYLAMGLGPYSKLPGLYGAPPLSTQSFISGADAVAMIGRLGEDGIRVKWLFLATDIPFMLLNTFVFSAFLAFAVRRLSWVEKTWSRALIALPLVFLMVDFTEDVFQALLLLTKSVPIGAIEGVLTGVKLFIYSGVGIISVLAAAIGVFVWLFAAVTQKT